ncbi:SDR family NAD(P)-dependent oxidoreductase [Flavivirga sp. 57AJ16]|uniref:SDR family NAD(P)-dependent oxidoreductase n=1 Tax=Flavivirga sp. 57AJ16 TaxID=3025307 RepID=UPI00236549F9|nr:SDR family NAD(P)-dependent oxidoreductase [Flavivirga sp. 57AJ16]MDD7885362.1 SDR family NAD(P)-dependent oxidoreductase [Flavivirga sp. 57AJ16]
MKTKNIALVTESGNGFGKTFANIILNNKYDVILAASSESYRLLSVEGKYLQNYDLVKVDFTSEKSLIELKEYLELNYGKLDLLINNAEVANGFGQKIEHINIKEVKQTYEINVFTVIRLVQLFKPLLENSENPNIINVTSSIGCIDNMRDDQFCYSDYSMIAYATSKAALNMYTHLQRKEFKASKIDINNFDPILPGNCTHNSVTISDGKEDEFISLINKNSLV